jgi:hypothetical protein
MKVLLGVRYVLHHRPTVHRRQSPTLQSRRCQGWRRCGNIQQTPQRPFGPCRGQSLWMKVRWCPYGGSIAQLPVVVLPSTSHRRCQGWRRCGSPADTATAVRPVPRSIAVDEGALVFVLLPPRPTVRTVSSPTLQVAVVKDGAGVYAPADTATAVRPVPRSIAVDEGALVVRDWSPSPNCP